MPSRQCRVGKKQNRHSHKSLFQNEDPRRFDFNLRSITQSLSILCVHIFSDRIHYIHFPEACIEPPSFFIFPFSPKWGIISLSIFPGPSPVAPYSTSIIAPTRLPQWLARGNHGGRAFSFMSGEVHAEGGRKSARREAAEKVEAGVKGKERVRAR